MCIRARSEAVMVHSGSPKAKCPSVRVRPEGRRVTAALAAAVAKGWPFVAHIEFSSLSYAEHQDFMASFGYGSSDKHITATDADGVALAAIQGMNLKLEDTRGKLDDKQAEIDRLRAENEAQNERFASLEQRLLAMEASMN